jgi:hypothetical protein
MKFTMIARLKITFATMKIRMLPRLAVWGAMAWVTTNAVAMSGTTRVAWPGKPVIAAEGWPAGTVDLLNDPQRTEGWNPWFSECPNDVNHYAFQIQSTGEINRLLAKLATIKAGRILLVLSPDKEPRGLGFTTVLPDGNGAAAVFSIGSQKMLDEWFARLEKTSTGTRKFGVHTLTEPPKATPPTLTLYTGNKAVDLKTLQVPANVEVTVDTTACKQADSAVVKALEDFAARHKAGSTNQPSGATRIRSAELHSAVPQIFNLHRVATTQDPKINPRASKIRSPSSVQHPAECNSAIQQISNLRYGNAELHSAVPQIFNLHRVATTQDPTINPRANTIPSPSPVQHPAESNSAIQQISNLRYMIS